MTTPVPECEPLLHACTPTVYIQNAFRITGLPVDASMRDIKRRLDDIKAAEEMGEGASEHRSAFALSPPPTLDQIREAAQRLHDPERRIVEEFFWFWPLDVGQGRSDPALAALQAGNKDTAFTLWKRAIKTDDSHHAVVAKHNLAVIYHLVALDSEHVALSNDLETEVQTTIATYWRHSFRWWEELTDDEVFWSLVTNRIRALDDARLTTGFARRLRASVPQAIDQINAMLAISFAEKGKYSQAANHITYMQETHQGQDDVQSTLSTITAPHKTRIRSAVEKALGTIQRAPETSGKAAMELLEAVEQPSRVLQAILPADDPEKADISDTIAETCLKCQVAYARKTEDWTLSLKILDAALPYAASHDTKTKLRQNHDTVTQNAALDRYMPQLKRAIDAVDAESSVAAKVLAIRSNLLPRLENLRRDPKVTPAAYAACADFVAGYIRGVSVTIFNEHSDLAAATSTLEIAIALALAPELCAQLKQDRAHLTKMKAESVKHNVTVEMRNDVVEVTQDFVRYNDRKLPCNEIMGIRFGISKQYTNGILTECSYLICVGTPTTGLTIECNRFMRSEDKVSADFNRILESMFHNVVPGIVMRVADNIKSGRPYQMGGCVLTAKGITFSTGALFWKTEHTLPWSDVRYSNARGSLFVSSAKDPKAAVSYALRDVYNAGIFEFIAKAVVQGR